VLQASGAEDFKRVFQTITEIAKEKATEDMTVIFLTDGCDTINSRVVLD